MPEIWGAELLIYHKIWIKYFIAKKCDNSQKFLLEVVELICMGIILLKISVQGCDYRISGRGDEVHMYPLSFAEFMSVYSGTKQDDWNEYMIYGGLPTIINITNPEEKINFLKSLFEETYISDIVGRHNVRNRAELEELLNILSSAIGSLTNPTKLSTTFKTIKHKKIRGFNVDVGVIVLNKSNEKGHGIRKQLEIDFVCNKGSKRYYIQSAYAIPVQEKMEQEQRSMMLRLNNPHPDISRA